MKIGIRDKTYITGCGFENGIRRIRRFGYECIDYNGFVDTETPLFALDDAGFERELCRQRDFVENEGLAVAQTHAPWRWPIRDATREERAERFEKMVRAIAGTALLGCRNFVVHPLMPWGHEMDPEPQKLFDINFEFMSRLSEIAGENGVTVCLENMPMPALSLSRPAEGLRLARAIDRPNFKICLDTGHCAVVGIQPGEAVRLLGNAYLRTLHVHDNDGVADRHWAPFTGVIDWADFARSLQEIGFEGTLSLETAPPACSGEELERREQSLARAARRLAGRAAPDRMEN